MEQRIQHIITDLQGVIKKSNQVIFICKVGDSLSDAHPFFFNLNTVASSEETISFECIHLTISKEEVVVDIDILRIGATLSVMIHDLTLHYTKYQIMAQEKNEINLNLEKSDARNIRLEEREQFKDVFIQDFSHELRNPLMHLVSFAELLSNTNLSQEQTDYVTYIQQSSNRLVSMLEDILDLGKINSGKFTIQNQPFSVITFVETLRLIYTLKAKKKGLKFKLQLDTNIPESLAGDEKVLFQILTNLLDNAIKFTAKGEVYLVITMNQKWGNKINLNFQVSDSGSGISESDLGIIFNSYVRLSNSNGITGTGLGLSIVKKLLETMKSEIKVTDNPEGGSIFYFDLNFTTFQNSSSAFVYKKGKEELTMSRLDFKGTKKKILVVEDDEKTQMVLFKYLLEEKRYEIDPCSGSENIIKMVMDNNYDFILMDINLPVIQGHEFAKIIRELPVKRISTTPILGITAHTFENDIAVYTDHGIDKVLIKPFSKKELLTAIDSLL